MREAWNSYASGVRGTLELRSSSSFNVPLEGYNFSGRNTGDFWTNVSPFSTSQLALNPDLKNFPTSFDPRRVSLDFTPKDRQNEKPVSLESS